MELDADVKLFAYWLAAIVDEPSLIRGVYHKPSVSVYPTQHTHIYKHSYRTVPSSLTRRRHTA